MSVDQRCEYQWMCLQMACGKGRPLTETRRLKDWSAAWGEVTSSRVSHDCGRPHPEAALHSQAVPKQTLLRPGSEGILLKPSPATQLELFPFVCFLFLFFLGGVNAGMV